MKLPGASFSDARAIFGRANRLDPENPEPLLYFYRSFRAQRVRPTANAIAALHYAAELAPQDLDLSLESALQHVADCDGAKARPALVRAAQHPHGGALSARATALIALIDAGKPVPNPPSPAQTSRQAAPAGAPARRRAGGAPTTA